MTTPATIRRPHLTRCLDLAQTAEHVAVIGIFIQERFTLAIPLVFVAILLASLARDGVEDAAQDVARDVRKDRRGI